MERKWFRLFILLVVASFVVATTNLLWADSNSDGVPDGKEIAPGIVDKPFQLENGTHHYTCKVRQ